MDSGNLTQHSTESNRIPFSQVIILGAGGAGMMCAIHASKLGREVLILDHAKKLGGKILISGGGRCNFTNLGASPKNYVSKNPHFFKSALSRYTPQDFIAMVEAHGIAYHEKKLGQQFCDGSAQAIVDMLKAECDEAGVEILLETKVEKITRINADSEGPAAAAGSAANAATSPTAPGAPRFLIDTDRGPFHCESLVIATGGLSIPKIGASGFGYEVAKQFGLKLIERAPALDGFTFAGEDAELKGLAGISIDCVMTAGDLPFRENILFTHSGLSGPAALQASLHWYPGQPVTIDFLPETKAFEFFIQKKRQGNRGIVKNMLAELLPSRFADLFCERYFAQQQSIPLPQVSEKALQAFCEKLHAWTFIPSGTVGYSKAEVTRGGVDTDELSSKTLEARKVPGLYFIGEVVDVTGWLGGYNFQWAWASAHAAAQVV